MFGYIKYRLRLLKSQGRLVSLIDLLVKLNHLFKSIKHWFSRNKVQNSLLTKSFGQNPDEWLDFIWNTDKGFFRPIQNFKEINSLTHIINKLKPKTVLEVSTANGGTLFLFCQAADNDAKIVSIDLPGGINGGGYPKWKERLYQLFTKKGQSLYLLRKNSHLASTKEHIKSLGLKQFDLIMIDADHSYEGVKTDFELYKDLISDDGIIVLHDVKKNIFDPSIQVDRFWNQIKEQYKTKEIINDPNQGNMGIGIVFKA